MCDRIEDDDSVYSKKRLLPRRMKGFMPFAPSACVVRVQSHPPDPISMNRHGGRNKWPGASVMKHKRTNQNDAKGAAETMVEGMGPVPEKLGFYPSSSTHPFSPVRAAHRRGLAGVLQAR